MRAFSFKASGMNLGQRGIALVLVLWVLVLLTAIVMEFCFSMRTEVNIARNYKEADQLYFYAQGGVHRAVAEVIYLNDPAIHQKRTSEESEETGDIEKEWRVDGTPYPVAFEHGETEVRLWSESGRINLNGVPERVLRKVISYFVEAGEERDVIVDSILDWRDSDDFHRINGAENAYYQSLPEPYECKNGSFDSVEELLLVRGVTPGLYYGKKTEDLDGAPRVGLKDIFTVFSTVPQLDINSASREVLMAFLGVTSELASAVIEAREEKAFANLDDLLIRIPDLQPFVVEVRPYIVFRSATPYYHITSRARMNPGGSQRGVECIVRIDRSDKTGFRIVMWKDILL
jgi:general secretion pathway protein K